MENMENQDLIRLLDDLKQGGFIYNDSDLCRKLQCSKAFLSEMKAGKRTITQQFVARLHEAFPDYFNPKLVEFESEVSHLLCIIEDHDIRFHDLANRILDGMGMPKKEKTA